MANQYVIQGFIVNSFTVSDKIKLTLIGNKEDIRAGTDDVENIVSFLEIAVTAGEDVPIKCTLLRNSLELTTYQHPFVAKSYVVKQDTIKLTLEAMEVENGSPIPDVSKSLAIHARRKNSGVDSTSMIKKLEEMGVVFKIDKGCSCSSSSESYIYTLPFGIDTTITEFLSSLGTSSTSLEKQALLKIDNKDYAISAIRRLKQIKLTIKTNIDIVEQFEEALLKWLESR